MWMTGVLGALMGCGYDPGRPVVPLECGDGFAEECATEQDCLDPSAWQCLRGRCYPTCDKRVNDCYQLYGGCEAISGGWEAACAGIGGLESLHSGEEPACVPIRVEYTSVD
jgi:hypothetical protein